MTDGLYETAGVLPGLTDEGGYHMKETVFLEKALPADFVVETVTTKPDKTAIKKAIQSGQEVSGASLVENRNLQIK